MGSLLPLWGKSDPCPPSEPKLTKKKLTKLTKVLSNHFPFTFKNKKKGKKCPFRVFKCVAKVYNAPVSDSLWLNFLLSLKYRFTYTPPLFLANLRKFGRFEILRYLRGSIPVVGSKKMIPVNIFFIFENF